MARQSDLKLLFFAYPVIAAIISLTIKANFVVSILLFLGVPSLILSYFNKEIIKKSALFSIIITIPTVIIADYIAQITGTWSISSTYFPRLFGVIVIEQFIWGFLYLYFLIMYYEYFLEHKFKDKLYYPNIKYIIIIFYAALAIFITILLVNPSLLNISYFYLKMGLILTAFPFFLIIFKCPNILTKLFKTGAYFFYFSFIYEITALKLGQWDFPGDQFIGWVTFLDVRFPLEELFFWFILAAITILSYYEFFDDDKK